MGMKDELRATLTQPLKLKGPNKPTGAFAVESRYFDGVPPAATKVDCAIKYEGARQLEDYTISPNGRDKIGRIISYLRQIAVDSVFNESLNIVAGGWNRVVKAAPKDHSPSRSSNNNEKQDRKVLIVEEANAVLKKYQESILQNQKPAACAATKLDEEALGSPPPKKPLDEQPKISVPENDSRKKIFIRSRL
ncbi:PREDICTED: uncharacterized protein LOC109178167 [Ipomoea nil]|uniref:uncharacterized protein LOC109178167 n=1 Tax=Ipomoea nil TaxID=35883 RepID=UPI000900C014|nr:PREDICTED: uncharacterized protein LOC109178167 [Ipomoea nil]